jgi:hypothetical protein
MHDSAIGRLIGVIVSPGKTFQSIAARPTWLVPLLVLALAASGMALLAGQRTDYREAAQAAMERTGQAVDEEKLDEQVEMMEKFGPISGAVGGLIFVPIVCLVIALLLWIAFKLLGSDMDYKTSFSVYLYAAVPTIIMMLLSIPVVLSRETITPEDAQTGGYLASNLAVFAPDEASGTVRALLGGFDLFTIWGLILMAIGYRIAARVSATAAAVVAIVIFLLGVGLRVGMAALFS